MTNVMEPRGAAIEGQLSSTSGFGGGELASLVRRWMAAGSEAQDRVRLESSARAPQARSGEHEQVVVDPPRAGWRPEGDPPTNADEVAAPEEERRLIALPRRTKDEQVATAKKLAVLIDARRIGEDEARGLLAAVGERGHVSVCRAYADWSRSDLGSWVGNLRASGLHSFHQFADDDDQALVAMTIDAVDIAREAALDEVVIAGDLMSVLPLVHRLHSAGVRVVLVGSAHTPHDVRAACDEFVEAESLVGGHVASLGRHRA